MKFNRNRILVAPLDWGLGHATRCIPIIRALQSLDQEVFLAGTGPSAELLKSEFPDLVFVDLPGYDITYPRSGNMHLSMMFQAPKIKSRINEEHTSLQKIISDHKIDAVISDNRYGLWSDKVPCAFITHQLFIRSKVGAGVINKLNHDYINKFDVCWIPDLENGENLGGELSHGDKKPHNVLYIGPLSRFTKSALPPEKKFKAIGIVSGPEPQRAMFESKLRKLLSTTGGKTLLVCGTPGSSVAPSENENMEVVSHLYGTQLQEAIESSETVICRPGYSTLMDLVELEKGAILVPTPGQTEQEYLAEYHTEMGHFVVIEQRAISSKWPVELGQQTKCPKITASREGVSFAVQQFLHMI